MIKKDIAADVWELIRKAYRIDASTPQSERQEAFIKSVVEYIESASSSCSCGKKCDKEKPCCKK